MAETNSVLFLFQLYSLLLLFLSLKANTGGTDVN